jgi:DNA repair protein RadD
MLRPYQQSAVDAALAWARRCVEPAVLDLATGAGKSHIIAAIAKELHKISGGKHVLCLAPSAELVTQNREKYLATGNPASIYSASAGGKCLRHPVVFGTPGTVKSAATRIGERFCAVIVDECHGITPTVQYIIEAMRERNPRLRVIGLSATPYRLASGYIYAQDDNGVSLPETRAKNPYFAKLLYRVTAHYLINEGYLTRPVIGEISADRYDTSGLALNSRGQFDAAAVDQAFVGHGRKTASIVADVIARSRDRKGVMFFAATVQHAGEIIASLPPSYSAIVTGNTPKNERARILKDFKEFKIKYLVNVSVLTTGFDAPHVDVIALLRATESVALMQQIIGRGLRLCDTKKDCLVLDYAQNVERHCPDGDIFNPEIKSGFTKSSDETEFEVVCPDCNTTNIVSPRSNPDGYKIDRHGYFIDLDGHRIMSEHGPVPGHHARRCAGLLPYSNGALERCGYRWTFKECPECMGENDIAARYCAHCKAELVDPNEKLLKDFKALKRDPTQTQTDIVDQMVVSPSTTRRGEDCLTVTFKTEYRQFTIWLMPNSDKRFLQKKYELFCQFTNGGKTLPHTVTYRKNPANQMYEVLAYDQAPDKIPDVA